LGCGSVAINGLLQRSHCRVGLLATGLGTTAATAAATAATAATAAIATDGCPGVHHFLNEWLDRAPVGVVGDFKRILVTLHLHLLKICAAAAESTTAAAAAATAATAAATTESAAATAAAESLREDAAGAHHQSCRHSADG
jgi:pyruvate/2-oxoglutarate dehydrogenase complex dihydrolipoamide acyltransferase (E2) component